MTVHVVRQFTGLSTGIYTIIGVVGVDIEMHLEVCDKSKNNFVLLVDWHFSNVLYYKHYLHCIYHSAPQAP